MARRYVIVGYGPAGATAAETIRSHDARAEITIVGDEPHPFYSRPGLAYLLTGTIPERMLYSRPDRDLSEVGVDRVIATTRSIEAGSHRIELADGRTLGYDRLLLAVGAGALRPSIPGIDLDGVVTLDSLDDARRILHLARRAKRACVVGGGITAVELAEGLAAQGLDTTYLMRGDRYWGSVLDAQESALVERRLAEERIRILPGEELAEVVGHRGRVTGIKTRSGREMRCQLLAVAIGIQPRIELAQRAGLATGRGIWTDATYRTSDPDIYAAGDVAEVLDPATGRRTLDSLWSIAVYEGRSAAEHMAGAGTPHRRESPVNVTRIGGVTTTLIGAVGGGGREDDLVTVARGDSEAWRERPDAFAIVADAGADRLRLLLGEDRIVGAVVMGDQTLSRPLQRLVRERVDIRPVRERLIQASEIPAVIRRLADEAVPLDTP